MVIESPKGVGAQPKSLSCLRWVRLSALSSAFVTPAANVATSTLAARVTEITVELAGSTLLEAGSLGLALIAAWGPDADISRAAVVTTGGEEARVAALGSRRGGSWAWSRLGSGVTGGVGTVGDSSVGTRLATATGLRIELVAVAVAAFALSLIHI